MLQQSSLKVDFSLAGEDCQQAVTDEAVCTVTGCALGTDVCHWMFKTKVNMVQGQEDGLLSCFCVGSRVLKLCYQWAIGNYSTHLVECSTPT